MILRPNESDEKLNIEQQKEYRLGVGMLLYLLKHSRPDLSNAVRELSKVMDGATNDHMECLHRTIKYVLDTKHRCLVMAPTTTNHLEWHLRAYCDSDYSGDRDTRHSVTGFIIYLQGTPISWKSKSQRSITLSSTEAEYVALSEVTAEIMFIKQILEFLEMKMELPIKVHVDNVGAIYLANNSTIGQRTKHIDVRYHYVREYIEDGIVTIIFVKSGDNDADIFTKNTPGELHNKHIEKFSESISN